MRHTPPPRRNTRRRRAILPLAASPLAALAIMATARAAPIDYDAMAQAFGEPVTLSATGTPLRVSDVPADMIIITQAQIRASGADNLADILRSLPGISVATSGVFGSTVAVRGYSYAFDGRLLVLLNGMPLNDPFADHINLRQLPVQLSEISQIEVVKGTNSALFGFNALSGVINIVTIDPAAKPVTEIAVRTGTQALVEEDAVVAGKIPGVGGLRLSAGLARADEFEAPASTAPRLHPDSAQLNAEGSAALGPAIDLHFAAGDSEYRETAYYESPVADSARQNYQQAEITASTDFGDGWASAYRTESATELTGLSTDRARRWDLSLNWVFKPLASQTLQIGGELIQTDTSSPLVGGHASSTDTAPYGTWHWQITDFLAWTAAVRDDALFLHYPVLQPNVPGLPDNARTQHGVYGLSYNAGLVLQPDQLSTLRLILGHGVQLTNLVSFSNGAEVQPNVYSETTPAISPTDISDLELICDRTLPALHSALHAAAFGERNTNITVPEIRLPTTPGAPILVQFGNIGHSNAAGAELGADGTLLPGLTWKLWYTYTGITDHLAPLFNRSASNEFANETPRHVLYGRLDYQPSRFSIGAGLRWQSRYTDFWGATPYIGTPTAIGDFAAADAHAAYQLLRQLRLTATAEQALQHRQVQTAGIETERRIVVAGIWSFQ